MAKAGLDSAQHDSPMSTATLPAPEEQSAFWNRWVTDSKAWESNPDNKRRAESVLAAIDSFVRKGDRILEVGCGTGWMTRELAKRTPRVVGQDLATDAIALLQREHPSIRWVPGDFMTADVYESAFEAIVCMETIAHVPDQVAFANRLVDFLAPGGMLVLTTQNPYVWRRTSWLKAPAPGQIRNWPSIERLKELFGTRLALRPIDSWAPGGDRGLPWLAHNRVSMRIARLTVPADTWMRVREAAGLGRSLLLVGRRKA
jgi:2-polyprenyl-3-methyl-5-hydroxy-6-metoxy-1,4-benzoquinol methylase